jgi:hypothetical protein
MENVLSEVFFPYGQRKTTENEGWYTLRLYNNGVAWLHFLQSLAVIVVNEAHMKRVEPNHIFASGVMNLAYPSNMLHVYDGSAQATTCSEARDVIDSQRYRSTPHMNNGDVVVLGGLFDLRNTTVVEYSVPGFSLSFPSMAICFFLMSWGFQLLNGWYISRNPDGPRFLQYVEYSLSGSLTIVIMASNTGIQDLYTVMTIFVLFFGMNVFGVLAEFMMHLAEEWHGVVEIDLGLFIRLHNMWLIPHLCGWAMFLFAWGPVAIKYTKIKACSENKRGKGVPDFIDAAIVFESLCYFAFGALQLLVLTYRTAYLGDPETKRRWKWRLDVSTVLLSFVAKTLLTWALLGPALTART